MAPTKGNEKPSRSPASRVTNDQSQLDLTHRSSRSGPTYERGSPYEQSGHGNPTSPTGNGAYQQHGTAKPYQPSAEEIARYRSERRHHDLLGVGSQAFPTGTIQRDPHRARMEEKITCPYHGPADRERYTNPRSGHGLGPMDRFLNEGPADQPAIFHRPDNGKVSTYKGCRCTENMQSSNNDTNGY